MRTRIRRLLLLLFVVGGYYAMETDTVKAESSETSELLESLDIVTEYEPMDILGLDYTLFIEEAIEENETILDETVEVVSVSASRHIERDAEEAETLDLLARIIDAESKGEPFEGKVAVGQVILNRVENDDFPDTIRDVIYQPRQFEPVMNGTIENEASDRSIEAAEEALAGSDIVQNALYFYNPSIAAGQEWFETLEYIATIENHVFRY